MISPTLSQSVRYNFPMKYLTAVSLVFFAFAVAKPPAPADAAPRYHKKHLSYVTAQSRYGNGSATGRVEYRNGYPHVQLPSGWWQDCEGNCREALRRKHLDFWETINEEAPLGRGR